MAQTLDRFVRQQRSRMMKVEAGLRARAEREALAVSLAQTAALAARRGETVEQADGRLRIWSRDGLRALFENDQLGESEYEAGLFFRACYETVGALPTSDLERIADLGGLPGVTAWRAWRAKCLGDMEALAQTAREATTLWKVAGEGRAMRSLSNGGADYSLNCKALGRVLDAIAERFGL